LHFIPTLLGGGAERQILLLASGLAQAGVSVHIAFLHDGPNLDLARACGAELHRLKVQGNYDVRAILRLVELCHVVRPDLIQTWLLHADVVGGLAARLCGLPWILTERSSAEAYSSGIKNSIRRRLGRYANAIVANSDGGLNYWRDAGFRGRGYVVRNIVVEEGTDQPTRDRDESSPCDRNSILIVGRLAAEKNSFGVLDALERVFARKPDARAEFFGSGPLESEILNRVHRSPLLVGRVRLHGYVNNLVPWFRCSGALLSLSRFEGTPNAVLEAMSHGCPVVISDIAAHREIADTDCGWLVPLDTPDVTATSVCEVLENATEVDRRSSRAKERIAGLSATSIASAWFNIYASVIRNGKVP